MTCGKTQQELDDFMTGRLVPAERSEIERHLLACPDCRSYADWYRDLAVQVAALPLDADIEIEGIALRI